MSQPQKITNIQLYNLILEFKTTLNERIDDFEAATMREFNGIYNRLDKQDVKTEKYTSRIDQNETALEHQTAKLIELTSDTKILQAKTAAQDIEIAKLHEKIKG